VEVQVHKLLRQELLVLLILVEEVVETMLHQQVLVLVQEALV
jgi:hypothetical protein